MRDKINISLEIYAWPKRRAVFKREGAGLNIRTRVVTVTTRNKIRKLFIIYLCHLSQGRQSDGPEQIKGLGCV
ncbi:hypothetical protein Y788_11415 [Pantoea dispersa 625]|nr:hypothetical protein Y788_11415 [Pantoea dispersa 625]